MLITLAIIGVVAALTIPTVVAKYQKQQYYTQFMKMYNTLSDAYSLASGEYGPMDSYLYNERLAYFNEKVVPYLKVQKVCKSASECDITSDLKINYLNSDASYNEEYQIAVDNSYSTLAFSECEENDEVCKIIVLEDGSFILSPDYGAGMLQMTVDTNGIKGPNIIGRDIFYLAIKQINNSLFKVMPTDIYSATTLDDTKDDCTTDDESKGRSCSARLVLEGKMNY